MTVAHHVDAALGRAEEPWSRDLDPRLHPLIGGVLAESGDRRQAAITPDLLNPLPGLVDRLLEGDELLSSDLGPVSDGDLPAQRLRTTPGELRPFGGRAGDLLRALALAGRGVVDVSLSGVDLAGSRDLQIRILVLLHPLSDPT